MRPPRYLRHRPASNPAIAVAHAEILAVEALERVDVLDLLDREDVRVDTGYAIGNRLALHGRLAHDETAAIGAEAVGGRVTDGERRRGIGQPCADSPWQGVRTGARRLLDLPPG